MAESAGQPSKVTTDYYAYLPIVFKAPSASIGAIMAFPPSPADATANQTHRIDVNVTVGTNMRGAFILTLSENGANRGSQCHLIPGEGNWPKSFAFDVNEGSSTGSRIYTLEARYKFDVSACQESSLYPNVVRTAPYQINWQGQGCNPTHGTQLLRNGSFEEGWSDVNESIQAANHWSISWIPNGQLIYDETGLYATGAPEFTHKLAHQLPPHEQPCQPEALILDGVTVYKIFNGGHAWGGELRQTVSGLSPGMSVKLTVPVLTTEDEYYSSASGVWINGAGGWVWAGDMGYRNWYVHQHTTTVPANGQVEVVIRLKRKWFGGADFFVDDIRLEPN
jgi:hypothetical protein